MAPTLNTAAGRKQRLNSLINLVDEGVAERIKLTADLRPTIPAMFEALQQLALGVRVQEDRVSNDGKPYKYTYERAPNIKAIDLLLRYANVTPEDTANMLLSYVRAEATVAEVDARLASYKAQNLAAQTAFTDEQRSVFSKMLITQKDLEDTLLACGGAILGHLMETTFDHMRDIVEQGEEAYQQWQHRASQVSSDALNHYLQQSGFEPQKLAEKAGAIDTQFIEDTEHGDE